MTDSVQAMKAQAAAEAGHYAAAVQHFAAALLDQPDNAELHEQQAQCLMELEQYDAAAAASERATELRPSVRLAWAARHTSRSSICFPTSQACCTFF